MSKKQLTPRAVAVGLLVGSLLAFSNTYFGLQTGWVTMGSLQSAILGYGAFRALQKWGLASGFSVEENVIIQTTSVATATMPLAAGTQWRALDAVCLDACACAHAHTSLCMNGGNPEVCAQAGCSTSL